MSDTTRTTAKNARFTAFCGSLLSVMWDLPRRRNYYTTSYSETLPTRQSISIAVKYRSVTQKIMKTSHQCNDTADSTLLLFEKSGRGGENIFAIMMYSSTL